MPSPISDQLRQQWKNPGDVLNLLLLIGGDIVQKAITQMVGYTLRPASRQSPAEPEGSSQSPIRIPLTPVAFSFGWVAFSFNQLLSAFGDRRLLPQPENSAILVNCANGFQRDNKSWLLDRLLRDHEICNPVDERNDSLRIDIFELGQRREPQLDHLWWLGWLTILTEIGIAILPWVLHADWGVMLIVSSGNLLAFFTCCLPQWRDEKWAGRQLDRDSVVCLTRGNGHKHAMILIGSNGCPDLETFATGKVASRRQTPILTAVLLLFWVCLLLSVSGLEQNTWYLIAAGSLGMIQNVYSAGATRPSYTTGLQLKVFTRMPSIIGKSQMFEDDADAGVDLDQAAQDVSSLDQWVHGHRSQPNKMPKWLETMDRNDGVPAWLEPVQEKQEILRVHGALKELEKWVPGAGLALLQVFFPTSLRYEDGNVRDNINKKFWRRASHTRRTRRLAEQSRRKVYKDINKEPVSA